MLCLESSNTAKTAFPASPAIWSMSVTRPVELSRTWTPAGEQYHTSPRVSIITCVFIAVTAVMRDASWSSFKFTTLRVLGSMSE